MLMTLENKVVLSTGIIVDIEASEQGNSERMEVIVQLLRAAVAQAFAGDSSILPTSVIRYDWLNDSDSNFGRCVGCDRLVSDYEKPKQICVLVDARVTDGKLMCLECDSFWHQQTQRSDEKQKHGKEYDESADTQESPNASDGNGKSNSATS